MTRRRFPGAAIVLGAALAAAPPATAQGKGHGNAFGHSKAASAAPAAASAPASGAATATAAAVDSGGVRNFASWLDDASVLTPGTGVTSFSVGYWRMAGFSEIDAPSFDVGFGVAPRVQAGASVPVYHAGAPGGPVSRGIGDLYLNAKVQLHEPSGGANGRFGIALVPLVQILSAPLSPDTSRVSWGLPVALELQNDGWRVYGSAGYFSRGSLFASAAIELPLAERAWITGTLTQSHSTRTDVSADALGLPSNRTDISGGVSWAALDRVALFGSLGRTLTRSNPTDTHLFASGGVAVNFDVR